MYFFFIFRGEAKYNSDEWQHYNPFVPPHHYMHNCGKEINKNIELFFFHWKGQKW